MLAALHEAKGDIFEEVFARSWSLLSEDAQKVLMVMPIFASSASRDAIEAASDVHHFALDDALGQLVQMWLVEVTDELESTKRRYSVHPLTSAFGEARLKADEELDKAVAIRISDYYLELARKYGGGKIEFFDLLEIEKENVLVTIDRCFNTSQWKKALSLSREIQYFLLIRGFWQEIIKYIPLELDAAEKIGDQDSIGNILIFKKGWMHVVREEFSQAKIFLLEGISKSVESGNLARAGYGKRNLGLIAREEGEIDKAKALVQEALDIAEQEEEPSLKYMAYSDFGEIEFKIKNYKTAESWYRQAITGLKNAGRNEIVTSRLLLLGNLLLVENKLDESHKTYQECLSLSQKYKRQDFIARAKLGIAKLYELQNYRSEALKLANEALILFQKFGMKKFMDEAQELIDRLEKKLKK